MFCFFFFKQKTAYEMRISDWSSDVCSSDLLEYLVKGSGPLTIAAGYGGAFYRADGAQGRPDTQAYLLLFSTDRMGTRLTPESGRSEGRRVGKEGVSTCGSRWSPYHSKYTQSRSPDKR